MNSYYRPLGNIFMGIITRTMNNSPICSYFIEPTSPWLNTEPTNLTRFGPMNTKKYP